MWQWLLNNIGTIAIIVTAVLSFAGVVVNLVFKNKPASKLLQSLARVVAKLPNLIKTAEKLGGTGEEKKTYVMEQALLYLTAEGVKPDDSDLEYISSNIDSQVKLTKELHTTESKVAKDNVEVTTHVDVKTDISTADTFQGE